MITPEGWQSNQLGSVIKDIGDGGTPNTNKKDYFGGSVPWVVIQDIKKHITSTKTTLTQLGLDSCSAKLWPVGTVILSTGATIGEVGIAKVPLATKQGIHGIVCSNELTSDFLYYKLSTLKDYLKANAQGSTIREVRAPFIRTIPISYPTDQNEQSKIAEILSKTDQAIEQTESIIAKQQRIKTGLMQDLLTKGIDDHGNIRSEATHEFKDSPLGRIPVEWECKQLSRFVPSAEYGISTSLGESGNPVLRMNNFVDGEADVSNLKYSELPVPERLWLKDGDVLFNRTNSWEHVGRTGIWRGQIEKTTFASYLVRLNPDPDLLLRELLNIWLNWELTQISMRRQATPAVQQVNINPTNLRAIHAAFPNSLDEQCEIVKRFTSIRAAIGSSIERLSKLRALKTGLMEDLLTGEVRVLLKQPAAQ